MKNSVFAFVFTLIIGPFAFIWAANTLFHFSIQMTIENWVAAFIIILLL